MSKNYSFIIIGGGLIALQTASIATGLFFAVILLFMCVTLLKELTEELLISEGVNKIEWFTKTCQGIGYITGNLFWDLCLLI